MTRFIVPFALTAALFVSASGFFGSFLGCFLSAEEPAAKTFFAPKRSEAAVIDGRADDAVWQTIPARTDFCHPWRSDKPQKTSLKIYHDEVNLYLLYEAEDKTPVFMERQKKEFDIAYEDRVEVYFEALPGMKNYYSYEMSPTGLTLDYQCRIHRRFDFGWRAPTLKTAGEKRESGYTVEAAYPLASLKKLGVLKPDGTIRAGFYRADFEVGPNGKIIEKWISWIDPQKTAEDFHIPQTLGLLVLEP